MVEIISSLVGRKDASCIALFVEVIDRIDVYVFDCERNEYLSMIYSTKSIATRKFVKDIPTLFGSKLNGAILQIDALRIFDFENSIELCKSFKDKFDALKIPSFFPAGTEVHFSAMIIAAKLTNLKIGDLIVIALPDKRTTMFEFEYTKFGWKRIGGPYGFVDVQNKINSLKCILFPNDPNFDFEIKLLNAIVSETPEKLILHEINFGNYMKEYLSETSKWMKNKNGYVKNYVIPKVRNGIIITSFYGEPLLTFKPDEICPASESYVIPKSMTHIIETKVNGAFMKLFADVLIMNQKCHRLKLTISVDENSFFTFNSEGILLPKIENLPKIVNEKVKSKIPIIGFCDDFSVVCVYKNGGYKFADKWNGIFGNLNFINFSSKEPKFGKNAVNPIKEKERTAAIDLKDQTFIFNQTFSSQFSTFDENGPKRYHHEYQICDLIKIMSMNPSNIKIKKAWPFKVVKNNKDEIMLEFYSHGEILKAASPAFLMALILQEQIKVIKNENGKEKEKPAKIGFCILDEKYENDEIERIKNGLKKACGLLKVSSEFFDV
uniref:Uncharacterized protein n=1 Tax=Panagrolaimus sp. PS1159 TaxID=55785 RepID=A0AC35F7W2_9BILA